MHEILLPFGCRGMNTYFPRVTEAIRWGRAFEQTGTARAVMRRHVQGNSRSCENVRWKRREYISRPESHAKQSKLLQKAK